MEQFQSENTKPKAPAHSPFVAIVLISFSLFFGKIIDMKDPPPKNNTGVGNTICQVLFREQIREKCMKFISSDSLK